MRYSVMWSAFAVQNICCCENRLVNQSFCNSAILFVFNLWHQKPFPAVIGKENHWHQRAGVDLSAFALFQPHREKTKLWKRFQFNWHEILSFGGHTLISDERGRSDSVSGGVFSETKRSESISNEFGMFADETTEKKKNSITDRLEAVEKEKKFVENQLTIVQRQKVYFSFGSKFRDSGMVFHKNRKLVIILREFWKVLSLLISFSKICRALVATLMRS